MSIDKGKPRIPCDYEMPDEHPQYDIADNAVVVTLRFYDFLTRNRNLTIRPDRTYLDF